MSEVKTIFYSEDVDIVYVRFGNTKYSHSIEGLTSNFVIDINTNGEPIGIEIFDYKRKRKGVGDEERILDNQKREIIKKRLFS